MEEGLADGKVGEHERPDAVANPDRCDDTTEENTPAESATEREFREPENLCDEPADT